MGRLDILFRWLSGHSWSGKISELKDTRYQHVGSTGSPLGTASIYSDESDSLGTTNSENQVRHFLK